MTNVGYCLYKLIFMQFLIWLLHKPFLLQDLLDLLV